MRFNVFVACIGAGACLVALLASPSLVGGVLSEDGVMTRSTAVELLAARLLCGGLGAVLVAGAVAWRLLPHVQLIRRITSDYAVWRNPRELLSKRQVRGPVGITLCSALVGVVALRLSVSFAAEPWFKALSLESGVLETWQAAALVVAAIMLVRTTRIGDQTQLTRVSGVLLAVALFVVAGEEVSWGQHFFGFSTPGAIAEVNVQGEFNLHNLGGYWANHVHGLIFLGYAVILPCLGYLYPHVSYLVDRLSLPLPGTWTIPFGILGVVFSDHEIMFQLWQEPTWRLSEARELLFATLLAASVWELRTYRMAASSASS